MELALTVQCGQDDQLLLAQQLGVETVFLETREWTPTALRRARHWVTQTGLRLAGIENLPRSLYARAVVGLPGREAQIEQVCSAVRAAGEAGIPMVGYRWTPPGGQASERTAAGRGDALVRWRDTSAPDPAQVRFGPEHLWATLEQFLGRVLPAAREAGLRLACHPDDPPVACIGDAACILATLSSLQRLLALSDSPCHGIDLCLGSLAGMVGADIQPALASLPVDRVLAVHVRNARGRGPRLQDAFVDEGDLPLPQALAALRRTGYRGLVRAAAPPGLVADTAWGHKGRAYDLGYLKAVLQVLGA